MTGNAAHPAARSGDGSRLVVEVNSLLLLAADAPPMTLAGKLITYVMFPALALAIPTAFVAAWRANKAAKARAVALAVAAEQNTNRLDTQDQALARLLEVINPIGAPNLTAVLTRIQADGAAQAQRLDDHIRISAEHRQAFELRLEALRRNAQ